MGWWMTIEEIMESWAKDCDIDRTELGEESLKIPQLHNKYYKMYATERLRLRKLEADLKSLKLEKYEFYTQGPNPETPKEWKLPPRGLVLKADVQMYMDADAQLVDASLRIGLQQEKVEYLENIIKTLSTRNFIIKNAIEWHRFTHGG